MFPPWVVAEGAILPECSEIDFLPKLQAGQSAAGSSSHVTWHLTFTAGGMESAALIRCALSLGRAFSLGSLPLNTG